MDDYYVLVEDKCNFKYDGNTELGYVYFGTEKEVREEMNDRYEACKEYGWDHCYHGEFDMSLHDDNDYYDCHIAWWMEQCPDFDPKKTNCILMKGIAHDGGGVSTSIVGTYTSLYDGERALTKAFGNELVNPSQLNGWDLDYCEIDSEHAIASVETMDAVVSFDLLAVRHWNHGIINDIGHWFDYLG